MNFFKSFVLVLIFAGCGNSLKKEWVVFHGKTMGTTFTIKYEKEQKINNRRLESEILEVLDKFDSMMSNWNSSSWVSKFNNSQKTDWIPMSSVVFEILELSGEINKCSNNAFDITISPIVEWWGFGVTEGKSERQEGELEMLRKKIGMELLEWREGPYQIKKGIPELEINCSAIAKGFGVDLVSNHLENRGVSNFMVEIGGEVRVKGVSKGEKNWVMGVRRPDQKGEPVYAKVKMSRGMSIATSGDYLNAFMENGRRYSHIINPSTGKPVDHDLTSVTVISPTCGEADALATACMVLGEKEALRMIDEREGCEAFFIKRVEGGYQTSMTPDFPLIKDF